MSLKKDFYLTLSEWRAAVSFLGIQSSAEYQRRYKEDPRLPSRPWIQYKPIWLSFRHAMEKDKPEHYSTQSEFCEAVLRLGIKSCVEYRQRYKEDPCLPSHPNKVYVHEWQSWPHIFGKCRLPLYSTLAQAQVAVQALGIKDQREYVKRHKEDPRLPASLNAYYKDEWRGLDHFLGKEKPELYSSLAAFRDAVFNLNISNSVEYRKRHKEDPRLPSCPYDYFGAEWQGWPHIFGRHKPAHYSSLIEAAEATRALGIRTHAQYRTRHREDSRLPSTPNHYYKVDWKSWYHFIGKDKPLHYSTLAECIEVVFRLGINNRTEYLARYKEDPCLPSNPNKAYANEWISWPQVFGRVQPALYSNFAEAREAVHVLGIKSQLEYKILGKKDPRLPAAPHEFYKDEWQGFHHFVGKEKPEFYSTLSEASDAVRALGIKNQSEYRVRRGEDPLLPSCPNEVYGSDWQGFHHFLGKKKPEPFRTLVEVNEAVVALRIKNVTEYRLRQREDPRLPTAPDELFKSEWESWLDTCLPKNLSTLELLKHACKILQIKDSLQYRDERKKRKNLPAHPERLDGWIDWYDLLDIPVPYPYEELAILVRKAGCQTFADYKKFRKEVADPRLPSSPIKTYEQSGWTNSYDFFGKPRPYQVQYLTDKWQAWGDCITRFLQQARGSGTKAQELCQFVRDYIQAEGYESLPHEFLTRIKTNPKPLLDLLNQLHVHKKKRMLYSINEFLNWIIQTDLTIEDEVTGEIVRLKNATNPFKNLNFNSEQSAPTVNETAKPSLPYQFVKAGREWIFPPDFVMKSASYSELSHLQKFSADWIPIEDTAILDPSDLDCVTKTERGKVFLWNPIFWTYTYALMQLPARGMQIVYCDSGEMDDEVPYFEKGKLLWRRNSSPYAGRTKRQGMIYRTENNDFGVHYTSNKTQLFGEGYDIPYMPLELAYWLIKLRDWQQKYNSIQSPTPWLDCKRTHLNELQRRHKGANCFLFREFGDGEPGTFGGRLADRLAATLFYSVKDEAILATYRDRSFKEVGQHAQCESAITLSRFSSSFTPHTMRVSLINAYAFEFGLPIEVIMKLVGHASIVMSVYYLKSGLVRQKVELGEKKAFLDAQDNARRYVEEYGIEGYRNQLTANNPDILKSLSNANSEVVYLWKDFGLCPVGGNSCSSGGEPVSVGATINHPVPSGYIGEQNCPRCRFFVTGPAFLMGLVALHNEIAQAISTQSLRNTELHNELIEVGSKIDVISHKQYTNKIRESINRELDTQKELLRAKRRKLNSEIETRSKKLDMLATDLDFFYRHIQNSKALVSAEVANGADTVKLIVPNQIQFDVELEESTQFHILSEVCENAELFHSCSCELAVAKRNQALDKFMINNDMKPQLMFLNEQEQVIVGNQLTKLMYARIHSWETIDRLISGELSLKDLDGDIKLSARDIKTLFAKAKPLQIRGLV